MSSGGGGGFLQLLNNKAKKAKAQPTQQEQAPPPAQPPAAVASQQQSILAPPQSLPLQTAPTPVAPAPMPPGETPPLPPPFVPTPQQPAVGAAPEYNPLGGSAPFAQAVVPPAPQQRELPEHISLKPKPVAPAPAPAGAPPSATSTSNGLNAEAKAFKPEGAIGTQNGIAVSNTTAPPAFSQFLEDQKNAGGPGVAAVTQQEMARRTREARELLQKEEKDKKIRADVEEEENDVVVMDRDDLRQNIDNAADAESDAIPNIDSSTLTEAHAQPMRVNVDTFFQPAKPETKIESAGGDNTTATSSGNLQGVRASLPPLETLHWSRHPLGKLLPPPLEAIGGHVLDNSTEQAVVKQHRAPQPAFNGVELSLYYYSTFQNQPNTPFSGRLPRAADLKLGGVLGDVTPLVIANIVMKVTGINIAAVERFEGPFGRCSLWLEEPERKLEMMQKLENRLWMSPVEYNYCVVCNDKESEEYLLWYLEGLKHNGPKKAMFPRHMVTCDLWIELNANEKAAQQATRISKNNMQRQMWHQQSMMMGGYGDQGYGGGYGGMPPAYAPQGSYGGYGAPPPPPPPHPNQPPPSFQPQQQQWGVQQQQQYDPAYVQQLERYVQMHQLSTPQQQQQQQPAGAPPPPPPPPA